MHSKQDLLHHTLLLLSQSGEWATAKTEWQLVNIYLRCDYEKCVCLTKIKERCVIKNIATNKEAIVGNCCVKQFLSYLTSTSDAMFASLKRVLLDDSKSLHPDLVDMAVSRGVIAPRAARIYKDLHLKRVLSDKQRAFRKRQNHRILETRRTKACVQTHKELIVAPIKSNMTRNSAVTITQASGSVMVTEARIVFEPTAYDGSESSRVNFVLEVKGEEADVVISWEESTEGDKALCSALTPNGLKVKINKETVRCWEDRKQVPLPDNLKDKACNAIIQWSGIWETKSQRGLCLKATDIEVMDQQIEYPFDQ